MASALNVIALTLATVLGLVACGGGTEEPTDQPPAPAPAAGAAPWPAPDDPLERIEAAGLEPATHEFLDYHVHAHLDVFLNGDPVEVPAAIGIDITDPGVRVFESELGTGYGGIEDCEEPCISPLHTHDPDGVIHTESAIDSPNTLGQFFVEWDVALEGGCVGGYCEPAVPIQVFVDGEIYEGNPAEIELTDGKEIAIVIGSPPAEIPATYRPAPA
jgi:hypothetical protein